MDPGFKRAFVARLSAIAKASSLLAVGACGSKSGLPLGAGDEDASIGGGGVGGFANGGSTFGGNGGSGIGGGISIGGTGGIVSTGGVSGSSCADASTGDGGEVLDASSDAWNGTLVCFQTLFDAGQCPPACDLVGKQCFEGDFRIVDVLGGPFPTPTTCCYDLLIESFPCYVGRTFFVDEGVLTAKLRRGRTWTEHMRPDVQDLNAATRRALGDGWARDGLFEHASVASFARFAMQLLAVGAPAELLRWTHLAAADEVHHAEMSFALASAYLGEPIEPDRLPFDAPLPIVADLAAIAHETVMEGCIGETVATLQALDALERATDPAVRAVLEKTVLDEARHAELAWRFMAWALDAGGSDVHVAVSRAFVAFQPPAPRNEDLTGVDLEQYRAHGRETAPKARAIAERVLREVVAPISRTLLARPGPMSACA
jgi:hypothetical protein